MSRSDVIVTFVALIAVAVLCGILLRGLPFEWHNPAACEIEAEIDGRVGLYFHPKDSGPAARRRLGFFTMTAAAREEAAALGCPLDTRGTTP